MTDALLDFGNVIATAVPVVSSFGSIIVLGMGVALLTWVTFTGLSLMGGRRGAVRTGRSSVPTVARLSSASTGSGIRVSGTAAGRKLKADVDARRAERGREEARGEHVTARVQAALDRDAARRSGGGAA